MRFDQLTLCLMYAILDLYHHWTASHAPEEWANQPINGYPAREESAKSVVPQQPITLEATLYYFVSQEKFYVTAYRPLATSIFGQ